MTRSKYHGHEFEISVPLIKHRKGAVWKVTQCCIVATLIIQAKKGSIPWNVFPSFAQEQPHTKQRRSYSWRGEVVLSFLTSI